MSDSNTGMARVSSCISDSNRSIVGVSYVSDSNRGLARVSLCVFDSITGIGCIARFLSGASDGNRG